MFDKFLLFIRYNNAFAIAIVLLFSGFGVTYAASPEVRDSVYASKQTVVSVDNHAIVAVDLNNFNFNLRINTVTDDSKNYYVAYSYQTLVIADDIWQVTPVNKTLTVNKDSLDGKDLGLYAAKELGDNMDYELSYLKRVQKLEIEKGASQKVVTTEYSGLVGRLLNPKESVIEGYNPVIPEPVPEVASPEPAVTPTENPVAHPEPQTTPAPVVQPPTEPAPEATSTATSTPPAPAPEPTATSTPASDTTATSAPTVDAVATSTPTAPEPVATTSEAVPAPEVAPDSADAATSTQPQS